MGRASSVRRAVGLIVAALCLAGGVTGCGSEASGERRAAETSARAQAAAAPRRDLALGLALNLRQGDLAYRQRHARLARLAGARIVRDDIRWEDAEPQRGEWDWTAGDASFAVSAEAGLRMLPLLNRTPAWSSGRRTRSYDVMPRDPRDYARFVTAVVARYGRGGTFWRDRPGLDARLAPTWFELYNEPYGLPRAEGGPEPEAYARAVAAAVPAARRVSASSRFLIAGETTANPSDGPQSPWLSAVYDAVPDFSRWVDGIAVHPYSETASPARWTPRQVQERGQFRRVERIRSEMLRRGDGDKPVWITEVGWSTCPDGAACVTQRQQARHLSQAIGIASSRWPWAQALFVYSLEDYVAPRRSKEGWFGLLRHGGRAKPAWAIFQRAARAQAG